MNFEDLVTKAKQMKPTPSGPVALYPELTCALDDLVHNLKSQEASNINNDGIDAQVAYIKECLSIGAATQALQEALGEED